MSTINTGSFPKLLWPGIKRVWGMEYEQLVPLWPKIFESLTSEQAYEEDVETVGFGLLSVKGEGAGITYDTAQQGYVSRYTHLAYSKGYTVTKEQIADNLYEKISLKNAKAFAHSLHETEETVHWNVLNRAFNSSYTGGDGVELCSTAHPTTGGNQSNELATAADFSEASVEDLVTQIEQAKNNRGLRFSNMPKCLILPSELRWEGRRVMGSPLQNDTANNAINVLYQDKTIPDMVVSPYLTDADAWFIKTNCKNGLTHYTREKAQFETDNDFDTKNFKASVYARWSQGHTDWRGIYGTPGS